MKNWGKVISKYLVCFSIFVATLVSGLFGIGSFFANQESLHNTTTNEKPIVNTLTLESDFTTNQYIIFAGKAYEYVPEQEAVSTATVSETKNICFDANNKLELIFIEDSVSTLSSFAVSNENIASKLTAELKDTKIDMTVVDKYDTVEISSSVDAKYTLNSLVFSSNNKLCYSNLVFNLGEFSGNTSFMNATAATEAKVVSISDGELDLSGSKEYVGESGHRAVMQTGGTLTLSGITLNSFSVSGNGGAVYQSAGTLNTNCTIKNCSATAGAGIYSAGTLNVTGGTISKNNATNGGAGILIAGGTATLANVSVQDNITTGSYGHAIYATDGATVNVNSGTYSTQNSTYPASTVIVGEATMNLFGGTFKGYNYAFDTFSAAEDGAKYVLKGNPTVEASSGIHFWLNQYTYLTVETTLTKSYTVYKSALTSIDDNDVSNSYIAYGTNSTQMDAAEKKISVSNYAHYHQNSTEMKDDYLVCEYKSYTASFDGNTGSDCDDIVQKYTKPLGTLPNSLKTGYTQEGWFTAASGGSEISSSTTMPANNITYYAQWTANNYTVTFNPNGGAVSTTSKTVTYDSTYGTLPTPTRTGYTFLGWNGKNLLDLSSSLITPSGTTFVEDGKLSFNVKTGTNTISGFKVQTYLNGSYTSRQLFSTSKLGYNEYEIKKDSSFNQLRIAVNGSTSDSNYLVDVSHLVDGTTYLMSFNIDSFDGAACTCVVSNIMIEEGKTYTGYQPHYVLSTSTVNIASNHTLTAKWKINSYTVHIFKGQEQLLDAAALAKPATTSGNTCTVSYSPENGGTWTSTPTDSVDPFVVLTQTVNLTKGTQYYFHMTIRNTDGTVPTSGSMQLFIGPNGSYTEGNSVRFQLGGGLATFTAPSTATYKLRLDNDYSGKQVVVTNFWVSSASATNYQTATVNYAATYDLGTPSRTGHTFDGWTVATSNYSINSSAHTISGSASVSGTTLTMGAGNAFVFANYDRNSYTVTINSNNTDYGTVNKSSVTAYYGAAVSTNGSTLSIGADSVTATPATSTAQYTYSLESWDNATGSITANRTITANFTRVINTYTVTITPNNSDYGSVSKTSVVVNYGTTYSTSGSKLTLGTTEITATPKTNTAKYTYGFYNWSSTSGTVTGNLEITAIFTQTINQFDVTIAVTPSGYGAVGTTSLKVDYGTTYSVSGNKLTIGSTIITATPANTTGQYTYEFQQWSSASGTITAATTITAHFINTLNYYTIVFDPNGGTINSYQDPDNDNSVIATPTTDPISYEKAYGTVFGTFMPAEQALTGYTFYGWHTTESSGVEYTEDSIVTKNVTLYAHWSVNSYVVNVDPNDGYFENYLSTSAEGVLIYDRTYDTLSYSRDYGSTFSSLWPGVVAREGYEFLGFYTTPETGGTQISKSTKITGSLTAYARWKILSYTVSIVASSESYGSVSHTSLSVNHFTTFTTSGNKLTIGSTVVTATANTDTAQYTYDFSSWSATSGTITGARTIYAYFTRELNSYTFTISPAGGTMSGFLDPSTGNLVATTTKENVSYVLDYGTEISGYLPGSVTMTGYTFQGWYNATSGGTKYESTATITGNLTLYAQWSINSYILTIKPNGGSYNSTTDNTTVTQNYNTTYTVANPTRTGYNFTGWTNSGSGSLSGTTYRFGAGSGTLTANWSIITFTLNIDPNGGSFKGYIDSSGNLSAVETTSVLSYTVDYGTTLRSYIPTTKTKTGYTFANWYNAASGGSVVSISTSLTSATTVYAQWTINSYTLTINPNGGTYNSTTNNTTVTQNYLTTYTMLTATRTGYTFSSWSKSGSGTLSGSTFTFGAGNCTLTASWVINKYTLNLYPNGGTFTRYLDSNGSLNTGSTTNTLTYSAEHGTTLANFVPSEVSRAGHSFKGWYSAASGGTAYATTKEITSALNVYAQWTIYTYTVTIAVDPSGYGTVSKTSMTVNWGTTYSTSGTTLTVGSTNITATPTTSTAQYSYAFSSWSSTSGTITSAITITAKFSRSIKSYILTIYANYGTLSGFPDPDMGTIDTTSVTSSKAYTVNYGVNVLDYCPANKTRTGYTFTNWYNASSGGTAYTTSSTVTGTTNVYAQWSINRYILTINPNGGYYNSTTSNTTVTQNYLTTYTMLTATRTGYTFSSWSKSGSGTLSGSTFTFGAGACTLTAQWTINSYTLHIFKGQEQLLSSAEMAKTSTVSGNNCTVTYSQANGGTWTSTPANTSDPYATLSQTVYLTSGTQYYFHMTIRNTDGTVPTSGSMQLFIGPNGSYTEGNSVRFQLGGGLATFTAPSTATYKLRLDNDYSGKQVVVTNFWVAAATTTNYQTATVNYAATYALGTPSRTGHTFDGWTVATSKYSINGTANTISGSASVSGTTLTMGAGNAFVFANYDRNSYTVTISRNNTNYGTVSASSVTAYYGAVVSTSGSTLTIGNSTVTASATALTGYSTTFSSWSNASGSITAARTITANFARSIYTYTLTLNPNGGTLSGFLDANGNLTTTTTTSSISFTLDYGTVISDYFPGSTTKTGHTFNGWFSAASGGTQCSTTATITANTTLYAQFTINSYTLTIKPNGGSYNSTTDNTTVTQNYNTTYTVANPTRTGYNFTGWSNSGSGSLSGTTYRFGAGNGTLTANWSIITFTLKIDPNGGTFTGYFDSNLNLNTGSTTSVLSYTVSYGTTLSSYIPTTKTKTGYTFTNWYNAASGGSVVSTSTSLTSATTVYAQWKINTYTLTIAVDPSGYGSVSTTSMIVNWGTTYSTSGTTLTVGSTEITASPTSSTAQYSYAFSSWSSTSGTITSAITITAKFTRATRTYSLTIYANGGTISGFPDPDMGTIDTTSVTTSKACTVSYGVKVLDYCPANKTRTGYTFTNWYNASSSGTAYTTSSTVTGTTNVYAQWKINSYTLTINPNGGTYNNTTSNTTVTQNYLTTYTLLTATRTGYTFNSWSKSGSGTLSSSTFKFGAGACTLTAQWTINTYTLTINPNGGTFTRYFDSNLNLNTGSTTSTLTYTVSYGDTLSTYLPGSQSRTGYTFKGWYSASSGGTSYATSKTITSSLNVYAQWTIKTYTVTISVNNSSYGSVSTTSMTVNHGTSYSASGATLTIGSTDITATATASTSQYAYAFSYWSSTSGTITAATTITANFTRSTRTYTLTFYPNGGTFSGYLDSNGNLTTGSTTSSLSYTVSYGDTLGSYAPSQKTKTYYTFKGWYSASSGGTAYATTKTITATTSAYAQWTANTYSISYTLNGGTKGTYAPTSASYGTGFTVSNPTKSGYTFSGWSISGMTSGLTHYYGTSSSSYSTSTGTSLSGEKSTWFKNLRSSSGTVTFTANWTSNTTYTVTNDTHTSMTVAGSVITSGSSVSVASGSSWSIVITTTYLSKTGYYTIWTLYVNGTEQGESTLAGKSYSGTITAATTFTTDSYSTRFTPPENFELEYDESHTGASFCSEQWLDDKFRKLQEKSSEEVDFEGVTFV